SALHVGGVPRAGAASPLGVGDRLDSAVRGAVARRAASMLVLSGVTGPHELGAAPEGLRPDSLAWDLAGLNEAHPEPRGWRASVRDGRVELSGSGDRLHGLRAVCSAAWRQDGPVDAEAALARLGW